MPRAALLSFRLGGTDGVSIEAAKWAGALSHLGFEVVTVAGEGPVDHQLPGLAIDAPGPPGHAEVAAALDGADLVVVENLCSLPLNPPAAVVVAEVCAGRPTILHHHDLPWQRPHLAHLPPPPDDRRWRHVTINDLSRVELAERGITAHTVYNAFDTTAPTGDRAVTRKRLGLPEDTRLALQPTRAIPRKNVAGGITVAEDLGARYWLLGPAEDGFGPELERLVAGARCPVLLGPGPGGVGLDVVDAYAACDVVVLPSTWEGFGNPAIESAVHGRPLVIGPYPVATELERFGFEWFHLDDIGALDNWLTSPDPALVEHNRAVADRHFSLRTLPGRVADVVADLDLAGHGTLDDP